MNQLIRDKIGEVLVAVAHGGWMAGKEQHLKPYDYTLADFDYKKPLDDILSSLHSTLKKRMEEERKSKHPERDGAGVLIIDVYNEALSKAQQIIDEVTTK